MNSFYVAHFKNPNFTFIFKKLVKLILFRRIVLINQPLVIVVSHKIIVHNLELIINSNIF